VIRYFIHLQSAEETAPEFTAPFSRFKLTWEQRKSVSFSAHPEYASIREKNQRLIA
jgi:hypothetical protein